MELIADYACATGENPLWHSAEGALYWCDIPRGRIFRYDPRTGRHAICHEGTVVGGFTVQTDGSLLLFMERGAVRVWRDGLLRTISEELDGEQESRFNDVIADPLGGVFCGTMSTPSRPGRLYRMAPDGSMSVVQEDVGCSNGLTFTLDAHAMYHTDSLSRTIYSYRFDGKTGAVTHRNTFAQLAVSDGLPDGITLDAEGCLWSAQWGGGCVLRLDPDGRELMRLRMPCPLVSSVAFGGERLQHLYITTAGGDDRAANGPFAGALFRADLGIRGWPQYTSRVCL
ncbi:MAG: SMP-30/gluconolactonase/LRE family protein [Chthoniobacterales bacterium]